MPKLCGFCEEDKINPDVVTYTCKNPDCGNYTNRQKGPYPKSGEWVNVAGKRRMEHQQYLINWDSSVNNAKSSFRKNDLGWVIYGYVRAFKPVKCVEFGVLHGYSTLFIGGALRDNDNKATLESFDRWPGHLPEINKQVESSIANCGLDQTVHVHTLDVVVTPPQFYNIDFLMVDLNNTAEIFRWVMNNYADKMSENGFMIFEGGSEERDREVWIADNNLTPIREALNNWIWADWNYHVIEPWPSLTIVTRK